MAKVSVIVPVYNTEKYLRCCMDSVIGQTLRDIEIVCVNDGSTDGSLAILQEYAAKDERIKIINQENKGYGKAVNTGLRAANGEYIAILEADDWVDEDIYQSLYEIARKNNLDIVKADFYESWSDGKDKRVRIGREDDYGKVFRLEPDKIPPKIWGSIWSALYNRLFLSKHQINVNETPGASYQDTGFIFKTNICAERMMLIPKPYLHYRQDNSASSVKSRDKVFCISEEYDEIWEYLRRHKLEKWINIYLLRRYEGCFWNLNRLSPKNRSIYLKQEKNIMLEGLNNYALRKLGFSNKRIRRLKLLKFSENLFLLRYRWRDLMIKIRSMV